MGGIKDLAISSVFYLHFSFCERLKKSCTLFYFFLGDMNVWKGFQIMEIKSAEMNAAIN